MKYSRILTLLFSVAVIFLLFDHGEKNISNQIDENMLSSNILSAISVPKEQIKPFLQNYPFPLLFPPVTIAEGFEAYDGNLNDTPGEYHWAIDYVQNDNGVYKGFPVYSAHAGIAFQGWGPMWGRFVVIRYRDSNKQGFNTLYSHLDNIPNSIPKMNSDFNNSIGIAIESNTYLGNASTTGNTKGLSQLHFELHLVDEKGKTNIKRADPYGIYKRLSSGLYPQPGQSLQGLSHFWSSNFPFFADPSGI